MQTKKVALVIVDISGYTRFITFHKTALLHAQEIISQLIETVIDKASHPLTLNKLEGDAAFLYAELGDDATLAARDIATQVHDFFAAFHAKAYELSGKQAFCPCAACQHIRDLRLKAVLHQGVAAFRKIRQFDEMTSEDVILAHRLLKNSIVADEYILMTEAFYRLAGELPCSPVALHEESYEHLGKVKLKVFYPSLP